MLIELDKKTHLHLINAGGNVMGSGQENLERKIQY